MTPSVGSVGVPPLLQKEEDARRIDTLLRFGRRARVNRSSSPPPPFLEEGAPSSVLVSDRRTARGRHVSRRWIHARTARRWTFRDGAWLCNKTDACRRAEAKESKTNGTRTGRRIYGAEGRGETIRKDVRRTRNWGGGRERRGGENMKFKRRRKTILGGPIIKKITS